MYIQRSININRLHIKGKHYTHIALNIGLTYHSYLYWTSCLSTFISLYSQIIMFIHNYITLKIFHLVLSDQLSWYTKQSTTKQYNTIQYKKSQCQLSGMPFLQLWENCKQSTTKTRKFMRTATIGPLLPMSRCAYMT